ncbi:unnamed protein product [Sphagnum balticum]
MDTQMSNNQHRLQGKVAFITGAASGLGEASARLFVVNGAKVVIADIQDEKGMKVATELGYENARFVHCNVTKDSDVAAAMKFTVSTFGKLDICFSNAGYIGSMTTVDQNDMQDFDTTMAVNLRGTMLSMKYAAQAMIPAKQGVIICTASTLGILPDQPTNYAISKAAVIAAVRSAASDLGQYGIRVNCISPTVVTTPLPLRYLRALQPNFNMRNMEDIAENTHHTDLAGASLTPELVATAALFLASGESAFISGHNLVLDGGSTTRKENFWRVPTHDSKI